jgi:hypothetical protein
MLPIVAAKIMRRIDGSGDVAVCAVLAVMLGLPDSV